MQITSQYHLPCHGLYLYSLSTTQSAFTLHQIDPFTHRWNNHRAQFGVHAQEHFHMQTGEAEGLNRQSSY